MSKLMMYGIVIGCLLGIVVGVVLTTKYHTVSVVRYNTPDGFSYNQNITLTDQSNYLINEQLEFLLKEVPGSAKARVGLIHGGSNANTTDRVLLLQFDVTNVRAVPGHDPGITESNLPLSQWGDYLPFFLSGKCAKVALKDMKEDAAAARMKRINLSGFIGCPLTKNNGDLLGGIFLLWETPIDPPDHPEQVEEIIKSSANRVISALDIRTTAHH